MISILAHVTSNSLGGVPVVVTSYSIQSPSLTPTETSPCTVFTTSKISNTTIPKATLVQEFKSGLSFQYNFLTHLYETESSEWRLLAAAYFFLRTPISIAATTA